MADASRRESIIAAMADLVTQIRVAGGFNTDLGDTLLVNEFPQFGPDDPRQAMVLLVGDEEGTWHGTALLVRLPITFLVLVDADLVDGWRTIEQGIADVIRAVEQDDDRRLDGLLSGTLERGNIETIPRDPGSAAIAAGVPYFAPFKSGWGAP